MKKTLTRLLHVGMFAALLSYLLAPVWAQSPTAVNVSTPGNGNYPVVLTATSATSAVNNVTTLTIAAPPGGLYNYVCYLAYEQGQDATGGTAQTDSVTTSTNFNSFAFKYSLVSTVNVDTGTLIGIPFNGGVSGCAKSTSPGTATTFVGPTANAHAAQTWYAVFYQGP